MISLVRYHTMHNFESSQRSAFVKKGRKWTKVVCIDANSTKGSGIRVVKVPNSDEKFMTPLLHKGKPYPVKRAVSIFRRFGKTHGITKGALNILKEAVA